jgi:hypothetical protein
MDLILELRPSPHTARPCSGPYVVSLPPIGPFVLTAVSVFQPPLGRRKLEGRTGCREVRALGSLWRLDPLAPRRAYRTARRRHSLMFGVFACVTQLAYAARAAPPLPEAWYAAARVSHASASPGLATVASRARSTACAVAPLASARLAWRTSDPPPGPVLTSMGVSRARGGAATGLDIVSPAATAGTEARCEGPATVGGALAVGLPVASRTDLSMGVADVTAEALSAV